MSCRRSSTSQRAGRPHPGIRAQGVAAGVPGRGTVRCRPLLKAQLHPARLRRRLEPAARATKTCSTKPRRGPALHQLGIDPLGGWRTGRLRAMSTRPMLPRRKPVDCLSILGAQRHAANYHLSDTLAASAHAARRTFHCRPKAANVASDRRPDGSRSWIPHPMRVNIPCAPVVGLAGGRSGEDASEGSGRSGAWIALERDQAGPVDGRSRLDRRIGPTTIRRRR